MDPLNRRKRVRDDDTAVVRKRVRAPIPPHATRSFPHPPTASCAALRALTRP